VKPDDSVIELLRNMKGSCDQHSIRFVVPASHEATNSISKLALRDHLMANFQLTDKKIIFFKLLKLYKKL